MTASTRVGGHHHLPSFLWINKTTGLYPQVINVKKRRSSLRRILQPQPLCKIIHTFDILGCHIRQPFHDLCYIMILIHVSISPSVTIFQLRALRCTSTIVPSFPEEPSPVNEGSALSIPRVSCLISSYRLTGGGGG